jgi:predicted PurR-regulated permease PerM
LALGYFALRTLTGLLEPVAWAIILVYAAWPLQTRLRSVLGGREAWGALLMAMGFGAAVIGPLIWAAVVLQVEVSGFFRQLPVWLEGKPELPGWLGSVPLMGDEFQRMLGEFENLQGFVRQHVLPQITAFSGKALGILEGFGFVVAKSIFTLCLMFFFFRDGDRILSEVRQGLVVVLGARAEDYLAAIERTARAAVYGIVLTAIVQGFVAGLGYWGVGLQAPVMLSLITMLVAIIPFGTVAVWVTASLWLFLHGHQWSGFLLFAWGALVVSWVDNVVRPLVISRTVRIPFVLVMLGVFGGLINFGLIGLLIGPVVLAVGFAVWREWVSAGHVTHSGDSDTA